MDQISRATPGEGTRRISRGRRFSGERTRPCFKDPNPHRAAQSVPHPGFAPIHLPGGSLGVEGTAHQLTQGIVDIEGQVVELREEPAAAEATAGGAQNATQAITSGVLRITRGYVTAIGLDEADVARFDLAN